MRCLESICDSFRRQIFLPFIRHNPADLVFLQGVRIFKFQERVRFSPAAITACTFTARARSLRTCDSLFPECEREICKSGDGEGWGRGALYSA